MNETLCYKGRKPVGLLSILSCENMECGKNDFVLIFDCKMRG